MANLTWKPNVTGSFTDAANWQEGVAPQAGDTATLASAGTANVIGEQGSILPNNVSFAVGVSQVNSQQATTSNFSLTDTTVPTGFTLNATLPGGSYQGGTTGPVIQTGLGIHGAVNFQGTINVGAGDQVGAGIDASRFSTATGAFNDTGTINLNGTSQNLALMNVNVGTQQGNATTNVYANYGTVNINNGIFVARAADAPTSGAATGTSTFNLGTNGYLRTENDFHANTTVNFMSGNSNRLLIAPDSGNRIAFGGTINGFQSGDRIGLLNTAAVGSLNYDSASQTLQVLNTTGGSIANLRVAGAYTTANFSFAQNTTPTGSGEFTSEYDIRTNVVLCFSGGTRIRTSTGEIPVERLRVGDRVVTAEGRLRPITWIGHRHLAADAGALPHDRQPIRIRANAFGPGLPARDLRLSPGHPVLVGADEDGTGGVLVPAMCLINGTSVVREPARAVTYWHVELDAHDILLAEGLAAESYYDMGGRAWFTGEGGALIDPDFVPASAHGRCRPVAVDGPLVEAERARLSAAFAAALGADCAWEEAGRFTWLAA
ncbi:Hint domain-containing protein [Methylobacterium sp. EM32]|uniref:Hint domain-containing protein n=1 Tax=Methylobacterium sp. EM32 TaxID=3163481 RepID=UPI0038B3CA6E